MKTTIELPDALFHRAKVIAARRRTTLKELVVTGLEAVLSSGSLEPMAPPDLADALSVGHNTQSVGKLCREELYDRQSLR